ncbi:MAG TPA: ATP-dependent Clp protease ATP-binding subunit [Candidatus Paceibacterota bacterium]|nr:ATP-dependent Clp protease ATP-binding subunit [Candidatus Paceibacterota bacterium]
MSSESDNKKIELYFREPRLLMTLGGRIFIRIASYVSYIVFLVAGLTLVFSDVTRLKLLGVLILLFFADIIFHYGEGDKPFSEMEEEGRINLAGHLSPVAYSALEKSFDRSLLSKNNLFLETAKELLTRKEIREGLMRLDLEPEEMEHKISLLMVHDGDEIALDKKTLLSMAEILVVNAGMRSILNNRQFIETADLFSGLFFVGDKKMTRVFNTFSVEATDLELAMLLSSLKRKWSFSLPSSLGGFSFETQRQLRHRVVNRAWTSRPTPTLDKFSSDLTDLARGNEIGFIIGHGSEYQRLVDTLSRPINPNALLVGEEGVGKGTMVMHLARQIVKDEVPSPLFDKRLVSLEVASLVAGASQEEMQDRIKKITEEIFMAGNIILYIPDFHNLVKTSGNNYLSAADALMPIVKENSLPIIGGTYPKDFKELIEPRSDITGIFEVIRVNEVSEEDAQRILVYESLLLEKRSGVIISFAAIKAAVTLGEKYLALKFLPSNAEELLKDSLIIARREGKKYLTREDVVKATEEKVNIPIHEASGAEAEALLNMEDTIHKRLIDQEEAVKAVSTSLREYRSGLSRKGGPIASFLFVGPTGVGKTELAKILARIQFGSEDAMVRFDMTEYQDRESFFRFIGSPDGRISGALTDAIFKKPYSLILLDEFEKAFPDILNIFLQVFDDGRLTDNLGRTIGFQNTIIIATSNAHSDIINDSLSKGEKMENIAEYLKRRLTDVFKPELINRFSKVIVFKDLSPKDVSAIARINLSDFGETLSEQGIKLEFDESAANQIAKIGYQPEFGARPLRRAIEENLRAPMAEKLLNKEIKRGDSVKISFDGTGFKFEPDESK